MQVYHVDKASVQDERQYVQAVAATSPSLTGQAPGPTPGRSRRRSIADDLSAESPRLEDAYQPVFPRARAFPAAGAAPAGKAPSAYALRNSEGNESKDQL